MTGYDFRLDNAGLTRAEKDILILGIIASKIEMGQTTARSHKKNAPRERNRVHDFIYAKKHLFLWLPLCI